MNVTDSKTNLSIPFYILLAVIFLLPIPLGSNRPWAWSFFQCVIFILSLYVTYHLRELKFAGLKNYMTMVFFWLSIIIFSVIQILPLTEGIVALLSPTSASLYEIAGANDFFLSVDVGQSTINFIKLLSFFCLFCLILQLVNSEQRIRYLLITMVASGTFQALYGSLAVLLNLETSLIFGHKITNVATGSFVYKNHYANFLMLCLCAGLGLIVTALEKEKTKTPKDLMRSLATTMLSSKAIIRICLALMVIALVMSRSRMGNTAFFISMAIAGGLALILIKNRSHGLFILVVSMFIVDLFIVSAYFGLERIKERLVQTSLDAETRDEVVRDSFSIIQDFPFFGSGAGSFYTIFPSYQSSNLNVFYDHAHNEYLQFTIEYGFFGVLLLAPIMMFAFYKALRAMHKRRNSILKGLGFSSCMAIIGMCIHMSVDFPLQAYANACYFVVFVALAMLSNGLRIRKTARLPNR